MPRYEYKPFPYKKAPELEGKSVKNYPVVVVGAGPVGLSAAIDLALHGIRCVVLDENDVVSVGSRAICWSKRSLEIFDRLGVGEKMVEKGVSWKTGRVYIGTEEIYSFDLLPEEGHKMPAFINLQQYFVEQYLVERAGDFPDLLDIRWNNKVTDLKQDGKSVTLDVDTPDGNYTINSEYALACDGAHSFIRNRMGLSFEGKSFEERFLIADVEIQTEFPSERRFWFNPPWNPEYSCLLHKQADNIYRIDLQLGREADPEKEKKPENVIPRLKRMLGDIPFELDWVSVYMFRCCRMERFIHGNIIFVGDSAHIVSPFGARGGNGGIQDADNLCWKLARVLKGQSGRNLLETYHEERSHAADENLMHSARTTTFMSPVSQTEHYFRDAVLNLASDLPFARRFVNSGRLSTPCDLRGKSRITASGETKGLQPGDVCPDAPLDEDKWLLNEIGGDFSLLRVGSHPPEVSGLRRIAIGDFPGGRVDQQGTAAWRFKVGPVYLIRPDQHIAAKFENDDPKKIAQALELASH